MKLQILIFAVLCWDLTRGSVPLDFDSDDLSFGSLAENVNIKDEEQKPKQACCLPAKFEGILKEVVGLSAPPGLVGVGAYFAHDFHRKLAAIVEKVWISHNTSKVFKLIANYNAKTLYFIYHKPGAKNLTCVTKELPGSMDQCLPKDAKFGRWELLGGRLPTRTYRLKAKSESINFRVGLTVAQHGRECIPVSQVGAGIYNNTSPFLLSAKFVNVHSRVRFPRVFNPPKSCSRAALDDVVDLSALMQFFLVKFEAE